MKLTLLACALAAVSAFVPAGAPAHAQTRAASPAMSEDATTRRALLASAILLAPAAANVRGARGGMRGWDAAAAASVDGQ